MDAILAGGGRAAILAGRAVGDILATRGVAAILTVRGPPAKMAARPLQQGRALRQSETTRIALELNVLRVEPLSSRWPSIRDHSCYFDHDEIDRVERSPELR